MSAPSVSVSGLTPFLVSITICAPLWAISVAQAARYYRTYRDDRKFLKYLVGTCVFLSTAQLAVLAFAVYYWLITCRVPTNYLLLGSLKRSMVPSYLTYLLTTMVQSFYAMRVWYVSQKRKYLVAIILVLSFLQIAGGFALSTYMVIIDSIVAVYSRFAHFAGGIELGSSMLCDIIISGSLVHFLRGRGQGFHATQHAVNKLILYSVNIGLVTNVVTLVNLVTWLAAPESDFTWAAFHFALGKIYVNSMLVSLNARKSIRHQMSLDQYSAPPTSMFDVDGVGTHPVNISLSNKPSNSQLPVREETY